MCSLKAEKSLSSIVQKKKYSAFLPDPLLQSLAECYWIVEGTDQAQQKIIPDGFTELIFTSENLIKFLKKEFGWLIGTWKLKDKSVYETWTVAEDKKRFRGFHSGLKTETLP